ncbi:MAG TPA: response regulator transcription factor [Candidatus Melainabacteria bacterium]|nr:response regulator transcription factor [Candidatus Melainabacteria bacterium]
MAKILVVEDDEDLLTLIKDRLTAEKFVVEAVEDGRDAMAQLDAIEFDAIVLDWNIPGMSGIDVLRAFRARGGSTPVIMLTGKKEVPDKLNGLDSGADDYIGKPFDLRELISRLRAILRRPAAIQSDVFNVRDITLDSANHKLTRKGKSIHLKPKDFALLEFFMRHPDQIFSSDALLERVWQNDSEASNQALRVAISRIRKALEDNDSEDGSDSIIENVSRVGYRLRRD